MVAYPGKIFAVMAYPGKLFAVVTVAVATFSLRVETSAVATFAVMVETLALGTSPLGTFAVVEIFQFGSEERSALTYVVVAN